MHTCIPTWEYTCMYDDYDHNDYHSVSDDSDDVFDNDDNVDSNDDNDDKYHLRPASRSGEFILRWAVTSDGLTLVDPAMRLGVGALGSL